MTRAETRSLVDAAIRDALAHQSPNPDGSRDLIAWIFDVGSHKHLPAGSAIERSRALMAWAEELVTELAGPEGENT